MQTLGVPTVSELVQAAMSAAAADSVPNSNGNVTTPTYLPQRSEEESDHKQYKQHLQCHPSVMLPDSKQKAQETRQ